MSDLESNCSSSSPIESVGSKSSNSCKSSISANNCSDDSKTTQNSSNEEKEKYRNEIDVEDIQPSKKQKCNDVKPQYVEWCEFQNPAKECPINSGYASEGVNYSMINAMPSVDDMQELHLIDEVSGEDESEDSDDGSLYESDEVPEEEIDALLEEGLPEEMKGPRSQRKRTAEEVGKDGAIATNYELKEKVLLVEKVSNHFEVLPDGWVEVTHNSGMPVFLHKTTRVCTFSRPYFLGPGSVRKHTIPISAIPCLKYLRDMEFVEKEKERREQEAKKREETEKNNDVAKEEGELVDDSPTPSSSLANILAKTSEEGGIESAENLPETFANTLANTRVESFSRTEDSQSIDSEMLREYCSKRFKFKTIQLLRFPTWKEKRKYQKREKRSRPQLPEGTKLISFMKTDDEATPGKPKKEWVLNPKGKSYVCILHEYVQHILKTQPRYDFKEVENAANPYSASIYIGDIKYCTGYGSSKKNAKLDCARATLEILIPDLGKKIRQDNKNPSVEDLSFFDAISVEDPNVPDWCNKASELSPYTVLLNCLQRNFGLSGNHIECKLVSNGNIKRNEFVMKVGKHTVQVPCKNKKDGKQRASQAVLQKLHPHIHSWGSLLRLYGNTSLESMREKKVEEQEITYLQTNATQHQPNQSIIDKLKQEMLKLREQKTEVSVLKQFLPPKNICMPSSHGTDLNNVDL